MTRLDFHSISAILLNHLKAADISQIDYMYYIFASFINDDNTDLIFDNGLVCHWIKGKMRINPKIVQYYISQEHIELMKSDLQNELFPFISDVSKTASGIKALLVLDTSISDTEKIRIAEYYVDESDSSIANFLAETLVFGISRVFVKAGATASVDTSPMIEDLIITTSIPKPVKTFAERTIELVELHELLLSNSPVFLTGIPGIGKSELAKQYIKLHQKNYTNILYLEYTESLYEMIADLDFADDSETLSEKERFRKHYRFIKTLKDDSLIVIDNFNATASDESLLDTFCTLKCKILFTSRNHFSIGSSYKIYESKALVFSIFNSNFKGDSDSIDQNMLGTLLEKVNFHTMSAELLARLLSYKTFSMEELNLKLTDNVLLPENISKLALTKDNNSQKDLYQQHFLKLLNYEELSPECQYILSLIAFAPETGFPLSVLLRSDSNNINTVNELEEYGLVAIAHNITVLNPYIRKIVNAGKYTVTSQYQKLFQQFLAECEIVDSDLSSLYLQIIDTASRFAVKDNFAQWIHIIRHALELNARLNRYRSYSKLLSDYEYLCYKTDFITSDDQYMLYHFKAIEAACRNCNMNKAVELAEKAIFFAGKYGTTNVLNFSTLYLDAGRYYHQLGNTSKSLEYTKKSAQILEETQMSYSPNGIASLIQYGRLLFDTKEYGEAIRIYSNCLGITNAVYGADNLTSGYISQNLAVLHADIRNIKRVAYYYEQAISILEKTLGSSHEDVVLCKSQSKELLNSSDVSLLETPNILSKFIA